MDEYLEDAWQNGHSPFHGGTVHNEHPLTLQQLRSALTTIVDWLEQRYGRGSKLLILEDWHEHDGFRNTGARIEWPALRAILSDDQRLLKSRHDDFNVYRAVYPVSGEWFVRWYIDDDAAECDFTFSASDDEAREVMDLLRPTVEITSRSSPEYFRSRYAG